MAKYQLNLIQSSLRIHILVHYSIDDDFFKSGVTNNELYFLNLEKFHIGKCPFFEKRICF